MDVVARLREQAAIERAAYESAEGSEATVAILTEAADEIERLRSSLAQISDVLLKAAKL